MVTGYGNCAHVARTQPLIGGDTNTQGPGACEPLFEYAAARLDAQLAGVARSDSNASTTKAGSDVLIETIRSCIRTTEVGPASD